MQIIMHPIGVIHSPFTQKEQTPIQASRSQAIGRVDIQREFADGLKDIEGFSHIHLLYSFHASGSYELQVLPFLDDERHGIFATRYPNRPNPIGISTVRLLFRQENVLTVEGVDVLDQTPLLDIKPYVPEFDLRTDVRVGWYETRSKK
jgi:tRNA-Thr(GGU) m(6)t(6)A37 methyltransferase TsaA